MPDKHEGSQLDRAPRAKCTFAVANPVNERFSGVVIKRFAAVTANSVFEDLESLLKKQIFVEGVDGAIQAERSFNCSGDEMRVNLAEEKFKGRSLRYPLPSSPSHAHALPPHPPSLSEHLAYLQHRRSSEILQSAAAAGYRLPPYMGDAGTAAMYSAAAAAGFHVSPTASLGLSPLEARALRGSYYKLLRPPQPSIASSHLSFAPSLSQDTIAEMS
ncbi:unnamed protein product [Cyprideis torosa]|uniref:Uncharacterized protein n=1 Tax=Cyprideis torosa TaxID=163714 RepID=A0A7R8W5K0_9CRUS|nr:unnamed protein product [Cyprideis torosa]CAG0885390.1 unnamed protein product [Cyprideis torosa]